MGTATTYTGTRRVRAAALALLILLLAAGLVAGATSALAVEGSRFRPPVESAGGIVATESPAAVARRAAVLERGRQRRGRRGGHRLRAGRRPAAVVRHRRRRVHGLPHRRAARRPRWTSARRRRRASRPRRSPGPGLHTRRSRATGRSACRARSPGCRRRSTLRHAHAGARRSARRARWPRDGFRVPAVAVRRHGRQRRPAQALPGRRPRSTCAAAEPYAAGLDCSPAATWRTRSARSPRAGPTPSTAGRSPGGSWPTWPHARQSRSRATSAC